MGREQTLGRCLAGIRDLPFNPLAGLWGSHQGETLIPVKGALYLLGAVVAGFLLLFGYRAYASRLDAVTAAWKKEAEVSKQIADSLRGVAAQRDTLYRQGETIYLRGRDRILTSPGGNTPEVRACFALSDTLNTLCTRRHVADTAALHAVERELSVWKAKPLGVQRIQLYGEAMYDLANSVPVIRAGATAKIPWVPIHLSVAGEYSAPPAGDSKPAFRALAGLRVNF